MKNKFFTRQFVPEGPKLPDNEKGMVNNMMREEILVNLTKVFREEFDNESIVLTEETTADDVEEWDSLEHINLIVAVEEEFGIKFTMSEVTGMKNVGKMVDIIEERKSQLFE